MANIPADVQKELLRLTDAKNKIIDLIKDCKENGQVENAKKLIDRYNQIEFLGVNMMFYILPMNTFLRKGILKMIII